MAAEARGFESLWFPEHSHIPVSHEMPCGGFYLATPTPFFSIERRLAIRLMQQWYT